MDTDFHRHCMCSTRKNSWSITAFHLVLDTLTHREDSCPPIHRTPFAMSDIETHILHSVTEKSEVSPVLHVSASPHTSNPILVLRLVADRPFLDIRTGWSILVYSSFWHQQVSDLEFETTITKSGERTISFACACWSRTRAFDDLTDCGELFAKLFYTLLNRLVPDQVQDRLHRIITITTRFAAKICSVDGAPPTGSAKNPDLLVVVGRAD